MNTLSDPDKIKQMEYDMEIEKGATSVSVSVPKYSFCMAILK